MLSRSTAITDDGPACRQHQHRRCNDVDFVGRDKPLTHPSRPEGLNNSGLQLTHMLPYHATHTMRQRSKPLLTHSSFVAAKGPTQAPYGAMLWGRVSYNLPKGRMSIQED